ncbi:MAG TPA: outer membrane protein assembly factor BamD [Candidatus Acidoferrum sp.]|nr:outer membrane protein assembly factor BamD [Candidatus Acidoferrum sp.]
MIRGAAVACVFAVMATGCATRGSVRQVGDDVRAVQSDVRGVRSDVRTVQGEVGALRQSNEDLSRRLTEVTNANQSAQAKAEQTAPAIVALRADVERLSAKVQATDAAVREVKETLAVRAAAPPPRVEPPPAPEPAKPARVSSAEDAFTAGLRNFRNREYGQAVLDFLDVVTKHPRHELASTAQYLIGEAYYLQHDYRQALAEFQRTVEWPVPHPKTADALLRIGLCHSHLREPMEAQIAWRRVVRQFPEAPAAEEARTLLSSKKSTSPSARRR